MIDLLVATVGVDYLGFNSEHGGVGLGVGNHQNILRLESTASVAVERYLHLAFFTRTNGGFGVGGNRAPAGGAYFGDDQIRLAGIGEMEGNRNRFSFKDLPEIMLGLFKGDLWQDASVSLAIGSIRIVNYIGRNLLLPVRVAVTASGER